MDREERGHSSIWNHPVPPMALHEHHWNLTPMGQGHPAPSARSSGFWLFEGLQEPTTPIDTESTVGVYPSLNGC
eukprot:scaffold818_cov388-Pavlova_lutheri.AAC.20